jgi:hypothetical protein
MKRTFITMPKLSSIALACALSLSASISGAAGESPDTSNDWYGRAGGPVAPASLAIAPRQRTELGVPDSSTISAAYGRAGTPVGAAAVAAAKAAETRVVAVGAGCIRFGRAGGPVGIDGLNCSSIAHGEAAVAETSTR